MYEVFVPIRADAETEQLFVSLVASGFLEEAVALEPDDRSFRVTAKGERFLSKTEELTTLVKGAMVGGPASRFWQVN